MSEQQASVAIGPLAGLRVIEIGGENGQWAGKLLADMGADLIKVEPPGGCRERRLGPFAGDAPDPNCSSSGDGLLLNAYQPSVGVPAHARRVLHVAAGMVGFEPAEDTGWAIRRHARSARRL